MTLKQRVEVIEKKLIQQQREITDLMNIKETGSEQMRTAMSQAVNEWLLSIGKS
jgi:hypothetical protein